MSGVYIAYGNIAVGAKDNAVVGASEKPDFVNLSQLKSDKLVVKNYGNPCENYQTVLDGKQSLLPNDLSNTSLGYWSDTTSDSENTLSPSVKLEFTTSRPFTSQGFTIVFDTDNNIYSKSLIITWYNGEEKLTQMAYSPDKAEYFCENPVEGFTKATIEFFSLNVPYSRLKVRSIEYGYGAVIYGDELRNVKLIQEINPISTEIPISTCDFTFNGKRGVKYSFQQGQSLSIYNNDVLKATTFIKEYKRKSETLWDIKSEDYIGVLDRVPFVGGIYKNKSSNELFREIFKTAGVPYDVAETISADLSGYIPYTTCRNALMQVALATRAVIDTSANEVVSVVDFSKSYGDVNVLASQIMQGESYDEEEAVTSVELVTHLYIASPEVEEVYKASESGAGEGIFIKFNEPLHDLVISDGQIIESGANYAIINANDSCVLTGEKYLHLTRAKSKSNPSAPTNVERIVAIEGATLVSTTNVDAVLDYCFDWLIKTRKINLRVAERKHVTEGDPIRYGAKKYGTFKYGGRYPSIITYDEPVNLGNNVIADVSYIGSIEGRAIRQTYTLGGGIIVKDMILR